MWNELPGAVGRVDRRDLVPRSRRSDAGRSGAGRVYKEGPAATRAAERRVLKDHMAAVGLDDAAAGGESETQSLDAHGVAPIHQIEHAPAKVTGHTRPVVVDGDDRT